MSLSPPANSGGASSTETYEAADSETISLTSRSNNSAPFLTDSSESAPSCRTVSALRNYKQNETKVTKEIPYPAELVKYAIKIHQNLALCNFRNVVHSFTSIVSYTGVLISEAGKDWRNDFSEITREVLSDVSWEFSRLAVGKEKNAQQDDEQMSIEGHSR